MVKQSTVFVPQINEDTSNLNNKKYAFIKVFFNNIWEKY